MRKNDGTNLKTYAAWFVMALSFSIVLFHRVSFSVILDYLIVDLQITRSVWAGLLAGMYAFTYMIMQIPSGLVVHRWGCRSTITKGLAITALGTVIFALAPGYIVSFLGRTLVGLGVSVVFVSVLKFQAMNFQPAVFATMSGLIALIGNLGSVWGTLPFSNLVTLIGWRYCLLLIGLITVLLCLLCWFLVEDAPSSIGKTKMNRYGVSLKEVARNPNSWILFLGLFMVGGTFISFSGTWVVSYLMQVYGITRSEAATFMSLIFWGQLAGFPLIGKISDLMKNRKRPLLVLYFVYIGIWAALFFWNQGKPPLISLYPLFFLLGFTAALQILILVLAKEANRIEISGIGIGLVNTGAFMGLFFFQPFMGFLLDLRWEGMVEMGRQVYPQDAYRLIFGVCLFSLILYLPALLKVKETYCPIVPEFPKRKGVGE